jgi:FlgD Ig-like domain
VAAPARSHYHVRNDEDSPAQTIRNIRIDGATMTSTNDGTAYGIYIGRFGTRDHVSDVLLGRDNVFVTSQPSDTLWAGNEFPRGLRPGSVACGRLRDAPGGRPTIAADPDTMFVWTGTEWEPDSPLDGPVLPDVEGPQLGAGHPNPFSPRTSVDYYLPEPGPVQLTVHDVVGRLVGTLVSGVQSSGRHTATWDGRDARGGRASSGTYFLRLCAERGTAVRKVVMVD